MARGKLFENPTVHRLQTIIESARAGELLFPDFQRDFTWDDEQRLRLLDSVLMGLPIGSFLVWRTSTAELAVKRDILPGASEDADSRVRSYVLDGLQRLTTLYRALAVADDQPDDFGVRWPIHFDLEEELGEGAEDRFHIKPTRGTIPETWLPMSCLFLPSALYAQQKRLIDMGRAELANKAERLANTFKDYEIPLIPLITDSLEQAARSFERVNSQGSKMDEAHMLRALTYRQAEFDLTARLDEITQSLAWDELDHKLYINTLKAMLNMDVYRSGPRRMVEALRENPKLLDRLRRAMIESVGFLHEHCGVHGERALPYAYQLVALAKTHHDLSTKAGQDGGACFRRAKAPLVSWFWATTYGDYFSHATGAQLTAAFEHLAKIANGETTKLPKDLEGLEVSESTQFRAGTVRGMAYGHLLAAELHIDEFGVRLEGASVLQRGSKALHKLYLDQPAALRENRFLAPPDRAREWRQILTGAAAPPLSGDAFFRGHLIPVQKGNERLAARDILEQRRVQIRELEKKVVESSGLRYSSDEG